MATYADIQALVKRRCGKTVKTCWIAHVKAMNGLPMRTAPNRISASRREQPCPNWARKPIEQAMRDLRIL